MEGGRGGAKSESLAHLLVEISEKENAVCLCTREVQNSISESVYAYIKKWVINLGYEDHFRLLQDRIINDKTGFTFLFKGMDSGTRKDSIKSISDAKYVWCEESQSLTDKSIKMLLPTVRVEGRKFFFSYNRKIEKDPVTELKKRSKSHVIIINFFDNPFLPKNLWDQAQEDKELDYEDYLHVWEGHPIKDDPSRVFLPYIWLEKCLNLHEKIGYDVNGSLIAGVDVAEGETDKHDRNSIVIRHGPLVKFQKQWQCKEIYESVGVIKGTFYEWGFERGYFDAVGVGVGIASEIARIENVEDEKLPFTLIPFKGSHGVKSPDSMYVKLGQKIVKNKDFFKNAKAQQWWNLRLRLQNSLKLLDGKKIDRDDYFLSFEGTIDDWRDTFIELAQATYREDNSGRKIVDKIPGMKTIVIDGKEEQVESPKHS